MKTILKLTSLTLLFKLTISTLSFSQKTTNNTQINQPNASVNIYSENSVNNVQVNKITTYINNNLTLVNTPAERHLTESDLNRLLQNLDKTKIVHLTACVGKKEPYVYTAEILTALEHFGFTIKKMLVGNLITNGRDFNEDRFTLSKSKNAIIIYCD